MHLASSMLAVSVALAAATAAIAKPGDPGNAKPEKALIQALNAMVLGGTSPPGQARRPRDPDMGDDNASLRAILTVCTKDTPAARRSAICDRPPVSPA